MRASGIDLAILGLGPNGHLGFNEPGSAFDSAARVVTLTPESITSNAVYWGSEADVPRRAYTLGLGTLAMAKSSILLVSGAHKAGILRRTLLDPPSPAVPATALRGLHGLHRARRQGCGIGVSRQRRSRTCPIRTTAPTIEPQQRLISSPLAGEVPRSGEGGWLVGTAALASYPPPALRATTPARGEVKHLQPTRQSQRVMLRPVLSCRADLRS